MPSRRQQQQSSRSGLQPANHQPAKKRGGNSWL
jgi:hypothetical protein